MSFSKVIVLRDSDFEDIRDLTSKIENLYIGKVENYSLQFNVSYKSQVELLFDSLIKKHGIRPVYFEFLKIEEPL